MIFIKYLPVLFVLIHHVSIGQEINEEFQLPEAKRFIDRVEVFAGPGISFNHGNKFIENYEDENISNKRLLKLGYSLGVGLYHPMSDLFSLNARFLFQKKGSKAELNLPLNSGRLEIASAYTYDYHTVALTPQVFVGRDKEISLSLGGYFSIIKSVKGTEVVYDTEDKTTSEGGFSGRSLRGLDKNGHVISLTYIPGLQSFKRDDYGIILCFAYLFRIKKYGSISVQLIENLGLQNINKLKDGNLPEKNHSLSLVVGYMLERRRPKP